MLDNASGTATRAVGVETPDARRNELRGKQRAFEINDVVDDLGGSRRALLSARHVAARLVDEPGALVAPTLLPPSQLTVALPTAKLIVGIDAPPVHEPGEVGETVRIVHGDQLPLPRIGRGAPPLRNTPRLNSMLYAARRASMWRRPCPGCWRRAG